MRPGFTLLEVLLATALASALLIAAAGWIETAAQARAVGVATLTWEAAAEATLRLIHDDVTTGDFATAPERRSSGSTPPRVAVDNDELTVATRERGVGPVTRIYRHDAAREVLLVRNDDTTGINDVLPLLDRVASFSCELDPELAYLTITIACTDGRTITRSIALP